VTATNEEKGWYRGNHHLKKENLCTKVGEAKEVKENPAYKNLLLALCNKDRDIDFNYTDKETDKVRI
jgi:hypothetical protein